MKIQISQPKSPFQFRTHSKRRSHNFFITRCQQAQSTKSLEQAQVNEDTNLYYIRKCNERSKYTANFLGLKNKDIKPIAIPREELQARLESSKDVAGLFQIFDRQEHQFDLVLAIDTLQMICKRVNQHSRKEERVRTLCRRLAEIIQPELRNLTLDQITSILNCIADLKFTFVKLPRSRSNINPYQRRKGAVGLNLFRDLLNLAAQLDDSNWNQDQIASVLWSQARESVINRFLFLKLLRIARENMVTYTSWNASLVLKSQEKAGIRIPELTDGLAKLMAENANNMNIRDISRTVRACAEFNTYDENLFNTYLHAAIRKFRSDTKYIAISELCYACYLAQHFDATFFDEVVEHMLSTKQHVYNMNHYEAAQFLGAFAQFDIAHPEIMQKLASVLVDKTDNRDCDKLMTAMFSVVLLQQPAWLCREVCDHFMILLAHQYKVVRRKIRRELPKDWYLKIYLCHLISEAYNRQIPINDKLVSVCKRHWKTNVEQQSQAEDPFKASVVGYLDQMGIQIQPNYVLPNELLLVDIVINMRKWTCIQLVRPVNLASNNQLIELHPSVMSRKLLEQLGWKVAPLNQYVWEQCTSQKQKLDFLEDLLEKYRLES